MGKNISNVPRVMDGEVKLIAIEKGTGDVFQG